jgi:hypothetical protein
MNTKVAKLVGLKLETITKREAAMRAKVEEMRGCQMDAEDRRDYTFAAYYEQAKRTAMAELEIIVAARQIKCWAAGV